MNPSFLARLVSAATLLTALASAPACGPQIVSGSDDVVQGGDAASDAVPMEDASPVDAGPPPRVPFPEIPSRQGPVLGDVQIVLVWFHGDRDPARLQALARFIPTSDWLRTVGAEYGIRSVTVAREYERPDAPTSLTDSAVQTWLRTQITNGTLPSPESFTTGTPVYMIAVPATSTLTLPGNQGQLCREAGGYHYEISRRPNRLVYGVVGDCNGPWGEDGTREIAFTHELIEAATDPYPLTAPAYTGDDVESPWAGYLSELADLCFDWTVIEQGFTFTRVWSNAAVRAGSNPCVPSLPNEPWAYVEAVRADDTPATPGASLSVLLTGRASGYRGSWQAVAQDPVVPSIQALRVSGATRPRFTDGQVLRVQARIPSDAQPGDRYGFLMFSMADTSSGAGTLVFPFVVDVQ